MVRDECIYKSFNMKKVCSCGNKKKIYKCSLVNVIVIDRTCARCVKYDNGDNL